ncbi:transposase [Halorubrum sp. E3]|nr:transposase [Halorubrum sp. E3]
MSNSIEVQRHLSETELDQELKQAASGKRTRRLGFVKNLYQGDAVSEAIAREGRSASTGYRWLKSWNDGGLEAVLPDYGGGRPSELAESDEPAFRAAIAAEEPVSTARVEQILRTEFDAEYAATYLPKKLDALGLTHQLPARERVDRDEVVEAIEWDDNSPVDTTRRHPYNEQTGRTESGWMISE